MKNFKWLSLLGIVCMSFTFATFIACDKADEETNKESEGTNQENEGTNKEGENTQQINPAFIVGTWYTVSADVNYVDAKGNPLAHSGAVSREKQEDWPFYNEFAFGADGSFDGWSINYNGDGEYYGNWEHTQLGKYSFDPATNTTKLYDLVMGYHQVQAYLAGQTDIQKTEMTILIQSLTKDELVCSINGMGTYKMKKKESDEPQPSTPTIDYAYIEGVWALVHKKGSDGERDYDKDFPTPGNDGYEELVFGPSNTVEHWKQKDGQWICDVPSTTYTRTENVISLGEMTITVLKLTETELMIDMGEEIITAVKLEQSAYSGNNSSNVEISAQNLVGTWILTHVVGCERKNDEMTESWDKTEFSWEHHRRLYIYPDETYMEEDKKEDNINWSPRSQGYWSLTDNKITIFAKGYFSKAEDGTYAFNEWETPQIAEFTITRLTDSEVDFHETLFHDGHETVETSTFKRAK